jgi:hypothetical protein
MTKKKTTKKTTKKTPAKKRAAKKPTRVDLPSPPSMPGQQEHIPETLQDFDAEVHQAALLLDESRKAAAAWGRETQTRTAGLEAAMNASNLDSYYDGVVRVVRTVKDPKVKLDVEVVDEVEAAE